MRRLLLIVISLACIPFVTGEARACSCGEYGTPVCAAYWRADAVFVGLLREITPVDKTADTIIPRAMLHFIVEQPFRGVAGTQLNVETMSGTSCDMEFDVGKRYLIYASLEHNNQLFARPCTRTNELKYAGDDLDYIRAVTQQGVKESIAGRLLRNGYEVMPGLKITVQAGDKTFETTTDEKGDFSVSLPDAGDYKVRALVPFAAGVLTHGADQQPKTATTDTLTTIEYDVQIAKNRCDYRQLKVYQIDLHANAEVSGHVLTTSGRPVNTGFVYLVHAADSSYSTSEKLEADGSFKFKGVAVGEYYLIMNPRNEAPGESAAPYPRTYYPNATEPNAAPKIVVTEGAKLENLTLRLGRPWKARVVTGIVVWQDKRPVRDGHISLYDGDRYIRRFDLDEKGRFNFKVYGDFKYEILAEIWGETHGRSERVLIPADKSNGLKLVLKPVK